MDDIKKYEAVNLNKLPYEISMQFEEKVMPDNSVRLIRHKQTPETVPAIKDHYITYGGDKHISIIVPNAEKTIDAIVFIYRTSPNHYQVVGMTDKGLKSEYAKTVEALGAIIKRNFCRTLLDD